MGPSTVKVGNLPQELTPSTGVEHQTVTVDATLVDVDAGTIEVADAATVILLIQVTGAPVRLTINGTAPEAGVTGLLLRPEREIEMNRATWLASKWISEDGTTATLQIAQRNR